MRSRIADGDLGLTSDCRMRDWEKGWNQREQERMRGRTVTCLLMVSFRMASLAVENVKARMIQSISELGADDSEPGFLHRSDFPEGFVFGSSSSAHQVLNLIYPSDTSHRNR